MLTQFQLIRNIGQFDSVEGSPETRLSRLTLIYAENGRGKTTLSAILRSLCSGDSVPIVERARLGAKNPPHVVIQYAGAAQPAVFQNRAWSRTFPNLMIFDDLFIDENVYSGLEVASVHRQNLHEIIVGAQGVTLARKSDELAEKIEKHNAELRKRANAIPVEARGALSVDDFCSLAPRPDIEEAIGVAEKHLKVVENAEAVRTTPAFDPISLPPVDSIALESVLGRTVADLDKAAVNKVRAHFDRLGEGGEQWVADGMNRTTPVGDQAELRRCPFCDQDLRGSVLFDLYRAYFSTEYDHLKQDIANWLSTINRSLGGDEMAAFQGAVHTAEDGRRFWASLCTVPEATIDTKRLSTVWQEARETVLAALRAKQASPLDQIRLETEACAKITEFESLAKEVVAANSALQAANTTIAQVKADADRGDVAQATSELARLKAIKARFSAEIAPLCKAYLEEKKAKRETERAKQDARRALDQHRGRVFPAYQEGINRHLERFNAGFRIKGVEATNPSGHPSCTYHIVINNEMVRLDAAGKATATPSFKNTLSSGDRSTLALAFFFASLDQDPNLAQWVVVIDDPVTSLDDHREISTVQEIRSLVGRITQVIVLSHDKAFLCRLWQHADQGSSAALELSRAPSGSAIARWNVNEVSFTEYDRRHAVLRDYCSATINDRRDVAQSLRFVLEGFLRVAYPEHFPPGALWKHFREKVRQSLTTSAPIMTASDFGELTNLFEYASRFLHDTNPAWETDLRNINDGELLQFVRRTLNFVKPHY